jgi:phage tail sheath protein FI
MFSHGISTVEQATPIESVVASQVQVVVGTAPVNLSKVADVIHQPFLCASFEEAKEVLGYSDNFEKYTLCEAMDMNFNIIGVSPVVFINVLDPTKHKKSTSSDILLVNGKAIIANDSILLDSVGLKLRDDSKTYVLGTDYAVRHNLANQLEVTKIDSGSIDGNELKITYDELDPSMVTTSDVIGSLNQSNGKRTGLELLRLIYPNLKAIANRLVIPKYSGEEDVQAAMIMATQKINGCFGASVIFDLKGNRDVDAMSTKLASLNNSSTAVAVWPKVKINKRIYYLSTLWSAKVTHETAVNEDFPGKHSNLLVLVQAIVNPNGEEIFMDVPLGNELNKKGIVTIVNMNGMRLWGNHTAAYPESFDDKDALINVKFTFIHEQNRFVTEYYDKVDDPLDTKMIESVVDDENIRYNALKTQKKIAAARVIFDLSENTSDAIEKRGALLIHHVLSPFKPAAAIKSAFSFSPYELGGGRNE